jgi:4-amino-4-deoxy-L-arabinose transferase-like glycosyltransferase
MPWYQLFGAGLLLSCATMTRGITLMFPLLLLGVWLVHLRSKKRALVQALIVWAGIAVLVVPWSIRNTIAFGQITGPSTNVGDDLCIGNYLGAQGAFTLQGKCFASDAGKSPQQVELDRNSEGVKIAIRDVASHPFRMPKLVAQKAYWLLYKDDDGIWAAESYGNDYFIPNFRREVLAFAANAVYYATGLVVLTGILAFALAKDLRRLVVVLAFLYVLALPLVFFGDPRFHYPAIPPAVVIAAATIVRLWDRRRIPVEAVP